MEKIKDIYSHLQDSISQKIFCNRLLYNITLEEKYLENIIEIMVEHSNQTMELYSTLCDIKISGKKIVIYGAGGVGKSFGNYLQRLNIPIAVFCDSNIEKQKHIIYLNKDFKKVISLEELINFYINDIIMIAINNPFYRKQVRNNLLKQGFQEKQIIDVCDYFGRQYFDKSIPFLKRGIVKDKIFIDAGCYDLGTALEFKDWNMGGVVLSFEPDYDCYKKCIELCQFLREKEIHVYQKGVWCKTENLKFEVKKDGTTKVTNLKNGVELNVVTIDEMLGGRVCGFIKMDIEGSEYEALNGAKKTIIKDHPILAISIYHKPEDIIKIPEYILELSGTYRFYIRHYSTNLSETILYAL